MRWPILDLQRKKFTKLVSLGFKRHARQGRGLDGGRDDGANLIKQWPVLGMYQPDAIATFRDDGHTYLVTANEGDVREYTGLNAAGNEAVEIEDITLDPVAFPDWATIQSRPLGIGRLKVTASTATPTATVISTSSSRSGRARSQSGRKTEISCSTAATISSRLPPPRTR